MTSRVLSAVMLVLAAASCGPGAPEVPVIDSRREEPSRQAFLGVEFSTYFEQGARPSSPLIVALHREGETPRELATMWHDFPVRVEIAIPQAPLHRGTGFQWFDGAARADDALSDAVGEAESRLWPAIAQLAAGRKMILVGFSQGAALVYAMAVRHPDDIVCAFPVGGSLPGGLRPSRTTRTAPVYALHGSEHATVPASAARATIDAFIAAGAVAEVNELPGTGAQLATALRDDLLTQVRAVALNLRKYALRKSGPAMRMSEIVRRPVLVDADDAERESTNPW